MERRVHYVGARIVHGSTFTAFDLGVSVARATPKHQETEKVRGNFSEAVDDPKFTFTEGMFPGFRR